MNISNSPHTQHRTRLTTRKTVNRYVGGAEDCDKLIQCVVFRAQLTTTAVRVTGWPRWMHVCVVFHSGAHVNRSERNPHKHKQVSEQRLLSSPAATQHTGIQCGPRVRPAWSHSQCIKRSSPSDGYTLKFHPVVTPPHLPSLVETPLQCDQEKAE